MKLLEEDGIELSAEDELEELLKSPSGLGVKLYITLRGLEKDFKEFLNRESDLNAYKLRTEERIRSLEDWKLKSMAITATLITVITILGQVIGFMFKAH